nr:MAG: hypothetical protein [Molluscum contagiosum virus]
MQELCVRRARALLFHEHHVRAHSAHVARHAVLPVRAPVQLVHRQHAQVLATDLEQRTRGVAGTHIDRANHVHVLLGARGRALTDPRGTPRTQARFPRGQDSPRFLLGTPRLDGAPPPRFPRHSAPLLLVLPSRRSRRTRARHGPRPGS